jgi:hypothetical protein
VPSGSFILNDTDYVVSKWPVSDLLQTFIRAMITSNYGFLFQPERSQDNIGENILTSFILPHPLSVSMDNRMKVTGCGITPTGNVTFTAVDPQPHRFNTTAALVDGVLDMRLQKRDGTLTQAMLAPGGRIDILLLFTKTR